jgi:hypothetical protein
MRRPDWSCLTVREKTNVIVVFGSDSFSLERELGSKNALA